jgi:3-methyladenine DNA glycosylase AlkD
MTVPEIMAQLEEMGSSQTVKTLVNHGGPADKMFGVKVGDMKTIVKKVKKNHELSLALYRTGNSDAMYLAGLIADEKKITKADLQEWMQGAYWHMLSEYTVAWIAAESRFGWELGLEWIDSDQELIANAGWSTLANYVSLTDDDKLDFAKLQALIQRVEQTIHQSPNRVRFAMNLFLICTAGYVPLLMDRVLEASKKIGKIQVNMGNTACQVPTIPDYLKKMEARGAIGKKKKLAGSDRNLAIELRIR